MQEVSREIFYQAIEEWEWVPFTQTEAYNLSLVPANTLHFYLDDSKCPSMGCMGYERRKLGLRMLCVYGECLRTMQIERKKYSAFYNALHETGYDIYEVNISTPYSVDAEIAFRTAGWLRPVGLFSTTLSKIINTAAAPKYDRSWKHNLQKAHEADLLFEIKDKPNIQSIRDFIAHHKALELRKGFSDNLTELGLQSLFNDSHFKMGIVTDTKGETVAGCLFYAHPKASTTIYSFSTLEGREVGAAYYVRKCIIDYLAQQGINTLDLGRLSPATHKKNNIFLFKDGIGGEYVQYFGEWLWCRKKWMPLMLYFMKKFIWKRVQV